MGRRSGGLFVTPTGMEWPSLIKSIQRGTITVSAGNLTNTATITAVNVNNTRLRWLGNSSTDGGGTGTGTASDFCRIVLTDSTTITATRDDTTGSVIVSYEVVEYVPGLVRSVERGTVAAATATSGTATITAVNTAKSVVDLLGWSGAVTFSADNFFGRIDLTNSTTVTLTRAGTANTLTGGFQVTQWF